MSDLGTPAPDLGGEPIADAPAEPGWQVTQEQWEQQQHAFQEQGQVLQQLMQQLQGGQQQEPEIDPFGDDFGARLRGLIQQELQPYQQFQEQMRMEEGNQRAMDILSDLQSSQGEFLLPESAERARRIAEDYWQEAQQRYGNTDKAAEAALGKAYEAVKAYELAVGKAYHEREMNQLRGLGGAPRTPDAAISGVQGVTTGSLGNVPNAVTQKWFGAVIPRG